MNDNDSNSTGEKDLQKLLKNIAPVLRDGDYVFLSFANAQYGDKAILEPVAAFAEPEGLTLVVPKASAQAHELDFEGVFKCITLQVHSSLDAVGLTAAFATTLTAHGISANVIAGFYHDHIFVAIEDADSAMDALRALAH